jgi:hypothetical protein
LRKASILLVPCLIGGALLAGCGGGDDSSSTAAALTKAEYLKQGNEICRQAAHEINTKAQAEFGNQPPSKQEFSTFITDTALPISEQEISDLRDLPPPAGDEDTVNGIYDAANEGLAKIKDDPILASQGDDAGGAFTESNKLAKDYGLTTCGR